MSPTARAWSPAGSVERHEGSPLLAESGSVGAAVGTSQDEDALSPGPLDSALTTRLYVSHFLSTWNSRLFEFGSVLFLAAIYPRTLMPISIYALARAATAILFSPAVGLWIDNADRLVVVRTSIVGERAAIAASCLMLLILSEMKSVDSWLGTGLFAAVVLLAGVEKLCAVMNSVSVTRDWVVVITEGNEDARRGKPSAPRYIIRLLTREKALNARIRRIDLSCKLFSPFLIASIDQVATKAAIWATLLMTMMSVVTEYVFIAQVYALVPALRHRSRGKVTGKVNGQLEADSGAGDLLREPELPTPRSWLTSVAQLFRWSSITFYARHPAFLPSFAYAFLHLTVLSFSGRMIAFLLAVGYDSLSVGIARTVSTIFELSATWISPIISRRVGSIRAGALSLAWQTFWLTAGVGCFLGGISSPLAVSGLVGGVIFSRIGLWGFDLAIQIIIQEQVEEDGRGAFSTAEASTQNLFEMLSYVSTMVFSRPDQFQWPMLITMASAYSACGAYTLFVAIALTSISNFLTWKMSESKDGYNHEIPEKSNSPIA